MVLFRVLWGFILASGFHRTFDSTENEMISGCSAAGATLMLTVSYQSYQIFSANGKEREISLPELRDRKIAL